jgi:hypothetical protein
VRGQQSGLGRPLRGGGLDQVGFPWLPWRCAGPQWLLGSPGVCRLGAEHPVALGLQALLRPGGISPGPEPSVEEKLQKLHSEIKFALKVDNPVRCSLGCWRAASLSHLTSWIFRSQEAKANAGFHRRGWFLFHS